MIVVDGEPVRMVAQVSGNPRPTITWFKQTQILKNTEEFTILYDEENVTTLYIRESFPEDSGTYTVVAKNIAGFASCTAELTVEAPFSDHGTDSAPTSRFTLSRTPSLISMYDAIPPVFARFPENRVVEEGDELTIICVLSAAPEPTVTLCRNGKPVRQDSRVTQEIEQDDDIFRVVIKIKEVTVDDSDRYDLIAQNPEGVVHAKFTITVTEKPKDVDEGPTFTQTFPDQVISEGDTLRLVIKVTGKPSPEVVWYCDETIIKETRTTKITEENGIFILETKKTTSKQSGLYKVVAKNKYGETTTSAKITIQSE